MLSIVYPWFIYSLSTCYHFSVPNICIYHNIVIPLHPQSQWDIVGGAYNTNARSSSDFADIIKRRLSALVLVNWNPENFATQGKSAINVYVVCNNCRPLYQVWQFSISGVGVIACSCCRVIPEPQLRE